MKYKVSLIIPVYNMEKYIEKCLLSVSKQTFDSFEAIIVNDGSKDSSQKIIDEFTKKYPKIFKSYIKENGGLSDARNYGISKANGEYLMFLDSDDWIEKEMIEEMYKKAEEGFDIVCCNALEYYDDERKNNIAFSGITEDVYNMQENKKIFTMIYPTAWNKIYRTDLIKKANIEFKKGVWFEDVEFIYRLLPHVKSIGKIDKPFYNYYQRIGGISKSFDDRIGHYIDNMNSVVKYYKENNYLEHYKEEIEYSYVRYLYATMLKSASKNALKKRDFEKYKELLNNAIVNVKNTFPNYRKNKYLYKNMKGMYLLSFNYVFGIMLYWGTKKIK